MNTETRWANAFRRAAEVGAVARPAGRDRWAVESATKTGTVYTVNASPAGLSCDCFAGLNAVPCYHKAAVLALFPEDERAAQMEPHPAA